MTDRYAEVFRGSYASLYRIAWRVLGDPAEAEDAAQTALAKLIEHPVLQRPDAEVTAWLRRVCLNDSFNRVRGRRRAQQRVEREGRLQAQATTGDHGGPLLAVMQQQQQAEVRATLSGLPARQRDCLLLRHSGHSYAEIAATLGVAIGSVGVLLARAERAFAAAYTGSYVQPDREYDAHDHLS